MACHQITWPYNFIKTQKLRCEWHVTEWYDLVISLKHKKLGTDVMASKNMTLPSH